MIKKALFTIVSLISVVAPPEAQAGFIERCGGPLAKYYSVYAGSLSRAALDFRDVSSISNPLEVESKWSTMRFSSSGKKVSIEYRSSGGTQEFDKFIVDDVVGIKTDIEGLDGKKYVALLIENGGAGEIVYVDGLYGIRDAITLEKDDRLNSLTPFFNGRFYVAAIRDFAVSRKILTVFEEGRKREQYTFYGEDPVKLLKEDQKGKPIFYAQQGTKKTRLLEPKISAFKGPELHKLIVDGLGQQITLQLADQGQVVTAAPVDENYSSSIYEYEGNKYVFYGTFEVDLTWDHRLNWAQINGPTPGFSGFVDAQTPVEFPHAYTGRGGRPVVIASSSTGETIVMKPFDKWNKTDIIKFALPVTGHGLFEDHLIAVYNSTAFGLHDVDANSTNWVYVPKSDALKKYFKSGRPTNAFTSNIVRSRRNNILMAYVESSYRNFPRPDILHVVDFGTGKVIYSKNISKDGIYLFWKPEIQLTVTGDNVSIRFVKSSGKISGPETTVFSRVSFSLKPPKKPPKK